MRRRLHCDHSRAVTVEDSRGRSSSIDTEYEIRFTGSRELRNKLKQAQELLRHRIPSGEVPTIFEALSPP